MFPTGGFQGGHPRVQPLHGQELVQGQARSGQGRSAVPQLPAGRDGKGERGDMAVETEKGMSARGVMVLFWFCFVVSWFRVLALFWPPFRWLRRLDRWIRR